MKVGVEGIVGEYQRRGDDADVCCEDRLDMEVDLNFKFVVGCGEYNAGNGGVTEVLMVKTGFITALLSKEVFGFDKFVGMGPIIS